MKLLKFIFSVLILCILIFSVMADDAIFDMSTKLEVNGKEIFVVDVKEEYAIISVGGEEKEIRKENGEIEVNGIRLALMRIWNNPFDRLGDKIMLSIEGYESLQEEEETVDDELEILRTPKVELFKGSETIVGGKVMKFTRYIVADYYIEIDGTEYKFREYVTQQVGDITIKVLQMDKNILDPSLTKIIIEYDIKEVAAEGAETKEETTPTVEVMEELKKETPVIIDADQAVEEEKVEGETIPTGEATKEIETQEIPEQVSKIGFFGKIWGWIKNLF